MSRRDNRFDADGNYLLPSEREEQEEDVVGVYEGTDDTDLAQQIKDAYPTADDLTHKSLLRAKKQANAAAAAPPVSTNPASSTGAVLGGQLTVYSAPGMGNGVATPPGSPLQTANWVGDDSETCPITITLAPVQQIGALSGLYTARQPGPRPYAIIQFGTRGMLVSAQVDIGTGCQLTVSGSSCTVQVCLDGYTAGANIPLGDQVSMILAGMVSAFSPIFRTAPLTRTIYFDGAQAAAGSTIVPPFAKSVKFWRNNSTSGPVTFTFFDSGEPRYTYTLPATTGDGVTGYMFNPIPIDGSIVSVAFSGADSGQSCLIFELDL